LFIALFGIIYSLFISLFIVDIKSIIAYSTIGQIAYILLALSSSLSISLSHIFIHSFYKCLLFLLSAEIMHIIQSNRQSIYNFYINNSLIRSYYILSGIALIFSSIKEGILNHIIINSIYFFIILFISSILSLLYILFLLLFLLFYNSRLLLQQSIFAFLSISFIISIADKSFHYFISIIDYPHSYPLYISAIISSVIIILLLLLFILSNIIFFIFYLSQ
jgi:NADH-quinone oxidoreductase subunit L